MEDNCKNNYRFVYFVAVIAGMGGLLFGFDTGIIADGQWQITHQFGLSSWQWSSVVSSTVLGAFLGALFCGRITDLIGRRKTLIMVSYLFIVGTLIAALSQGWYSLLIGRFILGACIGIASFTSPLFISEVSPLDIRGKLVLFNSVAITGGEAISFLVGYLLHDISASSWRLMFLIGVIPPVLLLIGLKYMPPSPRWVATKFGLDHARKILTKIRGNDTAMINAELDEIKDTLKVKRQVKLRTLFQKPIRKVMLIGLALGVLQQVAGINIIMYYGPFVFNEAGFSQNISLFATFIMGLINTVFTIVALFTVDKIGRRSLLIFGALIAGLSLVALAWHQFNPHLSPWIAFFSVLIYMMAFAVSLGCIFWLMISELYPTRIRGTAMSFATAIQWLANFVVSLCFLPLFNALGGGYTMLIFAGFCFCAVIFGLLYLPETKGVSLEQIEANLEQGKPARLLGQQPDDGRLKGGIIPESQPAFD
ncbi:sugar porter family MFS transporter [Facilibium subflavum]|uniref:sugar porter family MFS transporter n=1 Tax=Facilibium subflavum TaxID=2219058 RepID=UPI0013C36477|nr:sugar porter family MFS transporter [Facilibium subflavum]